MKNKKMASFLESFKTFYSKNKKLLRVCTITAISTIVFYFVVEKINENEIGDVLSADSINVMQDLNKKYGGVKMKPVFEVKGDYLKTSIFFSKANIFDSVDLDEQWKEQYNEEKNEVEGEIILKLKSSKDSLENTFRLKAQKNVDLVKMSEDYAKIPEVEYAEPNFALEIFDDEFYSTQSENKDITTKKFCLNEFYSTQNSVYGDEEENIWSYILNSEIDDFSLIVKFLESLDSRQDKNLPKKPRKKEKVKMRPAPPEKKAPKMKPKQSNNLRDKARASSLTSDTEKKIKSTANKKVIVAVVDSGFDENHPFLKDFVWTNTKEISNGKDDDNNGLKDDLIGWDFTSNKNELLDDLGHGTHVSGIVVAQVKNLNPSHEIKVMPVKVFGGGRFSSVSSVVRGIKYAADSGADIINLSLGGPKRSSLLKDAVSYAQRKNAKIISAAGNKGSNMKFYPASFDDVISVAAVSEKGFKTHISNFDKTVDLSAPGKNIYSSMPNNRYGYLSGTSQASPIVAGIAAKKMLENLDMKKDFQTFSTILLEDVTPFPEEMQKKFPGKMGKGYLLGESVKRVGLDAK